MFVLSIVNTIIINTICVTIQLTRAACSLQRFCLTSNSMLVPNSHFLASDFSSLPCVVVFFKQAQFGPDSIPSKIKESLPADCNGNWGGPFDPM